MEHESQITTLEKRIITHAHSLGKPITGTLELLPLCNMNCDMCYIRLSREEMNKQGRLRSAEEWISLGQQMSNAGVLFLLLTGGEPLLYPGFQKIYLELRKMGIILTINTNGTLLDEEWSDFFAKNKPRRINITLYGSSNDTYEKLCHYPGGLQKALNAVKLLKQRNVDVKINGSVTKYNKSDMEAIYQIAKDLNIPIHMDTYMIPGNHEKTLPAEKQSRLLPLDAAKAELYSIKSEYNSEQYYNYIHQSISMLENPVHNYTNQVSCLAGSCSFSINWRGQMKPCVTFQEPAINVFQYGFQKTWEMISHNTKSLTLNKKCTTCTNRPICKICPATAYLETSHYDGIPTYLCQYAEEYKKLLYKEITL